MNVSEQEKAQQLVEQGLQNYRSGKIIAARNCFDEAVKVDEKNSDAFNGLATTLCDLNGGEWNEAAVEAILKALRADSSNFKAWNNIGDYHYRRGEFDQAIEYFEKAIAHNPKYAIAFVNLALAFRNTNRSADALAALRQSIILDTQNSWARYQLGLTYLYRGLGQECLVDLEKAREVFEFIVEKGLETKNFPASKMVTMIDAYLKLLFDMKDLHQALAEHTQFFGDLRDQEVFGCLMN